MGLDRACIPGTSRTGRARRCLQLLAAILCAPLIAAPSLALRQEDTTVRAVLFYSPTCPHCHVVIQNTLIPLAERYGAQLEVLAVDTSTTDGRGLFQAAMQHLDIPAERWGVPALFVGDIVLHGSIEIPERFPQLVEAGLADGGIEWPDIPGLERALPEPPAESHGPPPDQLGTAPEPVSAAPADSRDAGRMPDTAFEQPASAATIQARLLNDPLGNALSIVVLVGMVASIGVLGVRLARKPGPRSRDSADWSVPILAAAGTLIAGYLAIVEATGAEAACGPVGDCNAVQHSQYALLFGALPVGVLGLLGYLAILGMWLVGRLAPGRSSEWVWVALLGLTAIGVLFSIYLTFLEPFVIGASCAWCLSSAVIMTALLWLTAGPAQAVMRRSSVLSRR